MDFETEVMDSYNEGVDKEFLPPELKCYSLRNPPNVNYSNKISTQRFMLWNNLIVGSNELHIVAKAYVNVFYAISTFVKNTPPTNIITNENIMTQYSIKEGLKLFCNKFKASILKELQKFHDHRVVEPKNPKISVMNIE